jgi:predicted lipoprotein
MRRWIAVVALLLPAVAATAQEGPGARISQDFAQPSLKALTRSAEKLTREIGALCQSPDPTKLNEARQTFADVVVDWGRASVLRFGPLAGGNRFERIFFWPDVRGVALRQVQQLLAEKDSGATSVEGLAGKSAALQGIPALEIALFGTGADASGDDFRCRHAQAIAANIADIARDALAGWQDGTAFADSFTQPGPDKNPYRSGEEVDAEIVKALTTTVQFVRSAEILPPFGQDAAKANDRRAPLWRSGLTFRLITAQIDGARALLNHAGYEDRLPADQRFVVGSIRFELDHTISTLDGIAQPVEAAFRAEEPRGRISFANLALDHAGHLISEQLAAALGLSMGFNALDGD